MCWSLVTGGFAHFLYPAPLASEIKWHLRLAAWVTQVQLLSFVSYTRMPACTELLNVPGGAGVDLLERVLALSSRPSLSFHFMLQKNPFSLPRPPE